MDLDKLWIALGDRRAVDCRSSDCLGQRRVQLAAADGRTLVWSVNQDGYSVLHAQRDGTSLPLPPVPGGVITAISLSADGTVLAVRLDTPRRPASVVVLRPGTSQPAGFLTETLPARSAAGRTQGPELIRYQSKDGTPISAWLHRPAGPGPHPVLLSIHGGPEWQERPEYDPLYQCLLADGIAVLAPNVRGSTGYGRAWQTRISTATGAASTLTTWPRRTPGSPLSPGQSRTRSACTGRVTAASPLCLA
jgi:dipeptidyl aminopeptidase/acylaminoacyl peptidase